MLKRLFFLSILSVVLLSACSSNDELSGKTFDVSVISGPNEPGKYSPIMTLEFLDGNEVKNKMGYEEGMYELKDDKLVIQFENENEYLEIEFTLEESDKDFSEYSAEISDSKLEIEDSSLVSKLKGFYEKLDRSHFEFIER
jgi:major membrane immunogen (membrane-anchored lipoprotein)